jgi:hypothetical protein
VADCVRLVFLSFALANSVQVKLGFEMWGIRLNAEGALAICAAIVLVLSVLAVLPVLSASIRVKD